MFYNSIPVGGDHITNDIAMGLRISASDAEKIKREYNLGLVSLIKNDHEITVNDINEGKKKTIRITDVVEIIEARIYEIFTLAHDMIAKAGISPGILSNVVLTGRGISYIDGSIQLAREVFDCKVRIASSRNTAAAQPEYIVAAGMVKYVSDKHRLSKPGSDVRVIKQNLPRRDSSFSNKLASIIKKLF
jgi:cell division protein FtsA